jgi:hypothetical protein
VQNSVCWLKKPLSVIVISDVVSNAHEKLSFPAITDENSSHRTIIHVLKQLQPFPSSSVAHSYAYLSVIICKHRPLITNHCQNKNDGNQVPPSSCHMFLAQNRSTVDQLTSWIQNNNNKTRNSQIFYPQPTSQRTDSLRCYVNTQIQAQWLNTSTFFFSATGDDQSATARKNREIVHWNYCPVTHMLLSKGLTGTGCKNLIVPWR